MNICPNCNSHDHIKKGKDFPNGIERQRFKCKSCNKNFYVTGVDIPDKPVKESSTNKTWVITTALNDTKTNLNFLQSLKSYCLDNDAELMVIPIKYNANDLDYSWDDELSDYITDENILLTKGLKLLANIQVSPTTTNPLSGFDSFCKGNSLIIPSPQIMMKTVAVDQVNNAAIMYTTGCISIPEYSSSKAGVKADFNHCYAALVVEEDKDIDSFHIRVLNSDLSGSFYDINTYYDGKYVTFNDRIPAIVLGDEHVIHIDEDVKKATFTNKDSIVNTLNPEYLIRHDVLDFYAASHHHKHDFLTQYKKFVTDTNIVEDELHKTVAYLLETTPKNSKSVLVFSNHSDEHITKWLNESNPKTEPWNAKLYHELMYLMLNAIEDGEELSPFELWYRNNYAEDIKFISDSESFKLFDIELGMHGNKGTNGSRGSAAQFSRLGSKVIAGHCHSCQIFQGSYFVGTSTQLKLDYNKGPSSWNHGHCIIQPNGKRQMIMITKGKWCRGN